MRANTDLLKQMLVISFLIFFLQGWKQKPESCAIPNFAKFKSKTVIPYNDILLNNDNNEVIGMTQVIVFKKYWA